jgi:hypothetical protein
MSAIAPYREATVPATERCFKLEMRPFAWKARMWRAFDDSVQPMVRLDTSLSVRDLDSRDLRDLLTPFSLSLQRLAIYLERGAGAPLPLPWSIGWMAIERERSVAFLHRVLEDPVGRMVAGLFRAGESRADVTLSVSAYEITRDHVKFAIRDYDIGTGADFPR